MAPMEALRDPERDLRYDPTILADMPIAQEAIERMCASYEKRIRTALLSRYSREIASRIKSKGYPRNA